MKHTKLLLGLLALLFAACAPSLIAPTVPEAIRVPSGQQPFLKVFASGVQIYSCKADASGNFAWTLKAPEANLFDAQTLVGSHYAGPTWESKDGSKVVGEVQSRTDSTDPTTIPWLLLRAKSTAGTGVLSQTSFIHRLATSGGRAPQGGCDRSKAESETRVGYSADYYFYKAR